MSTKFDEDSGADLWTHLNALDDQGVRWFPTVAARDLAIPAPAAGMRVVIGSGAVMAEMIHNGATWSTVYQPPRNFVPVVTASAGAFTAVAGSCRWARAGRMVTASFSVAIATVGTATGNMLVTLPVPAANANLEHGVGREIAGTGAALTAWISGPNACTVTGYDNVGRLANGRTYRWTVTYEAAE